MLTPDYLDTLPDALVDLFRLVEDDILRDIGRRIAKMDGITETAAYQAYRLQETRALHDDVVRLLAKYSGKSDALLRGILREAGAQTLATDDAFYSALGFSPSAVDSSPTLLALLNAGYRQTRGAWKNLTATTANTVTRQFETALDRAWLQVSSGAFDYNTAIHRACKDLGASGIQAIRYPTGHTDTLEVAVRRAVLTGVNQTTSKLQLSRMEEMSCEYVEVSAHAGARPEHAAWQGQVYHRGGATGKYKDFEAATGYGTGAGLCGWNCRHTFYPFFPGLSARSWGQDAIDKLNARDIPYRDRLYTRYEMEQMQRNRERAVRRAKREYLVEDAAGRDTARASAALADARKRLTVFVQETGGRANSARIGVTGFGRSAASKAVWAAKNTLPLRDPVIGRSVGAKSKNYIVVDKETGMEYHFLEGTKLQNSQVFAGKGVAKPLREEVAQGLVEQFGGQPEDWQHCKAVGWIDVNGEAVKAEIHWFQNGQTKEKFKVKEWLYDED